MRRREFIIVLAGAAATSPFVARAQPDRTRRIGVLMLYPENDPQGQLRAAAFQHQLEKVGWTVGGNLQIDYHWGTGDADWVRSAIMRVLRQAPDVVLANGDAAARAAQQSTRTVPVIFIGGGDAVGDGLVQSLAHPGGNLTGFAVMEPSLGTKLLGMLKRRGVKLGGYRVGSRLTAKARKAGQEANALIAAERAAYVSPVIVELKAAGAASLRGHRRGPECPWDTNCARYRSLVCNTGSAHAGAVLYHLHNGLNWGIFEVSGGNCWLFLLPEV